jgi:hypothetical protein
MAPISFACVLHVTITDRYKQIRYPETDEWELFDLETDPRELSSRYGDLAYADVQQNLLTELERLRANLKVSPEGQPGK